MSEHHTSNGDQHYSETNSKAEKPGVSEDQRRLETLKLQFEWHKHLTTLTSGIAVLSATVSYTVFRSAARDPAAPFANTWVGVNNLLILSFVLFFSGLLWSQDQDE